MDDSILLVLTIWLSPILFCGVFFGTRAVQEFVLVRFKGCIKANFVGRNHIIRSHFVKPDGPVLKIKDKTFNYNDSTGFVIREGSTPTVFYNEKTAEQIDMTKAESNMPLDPNHFSDLMIRAYNLGVIKSQKEDEQAKKLIFFILCGVGLCLLLSLFTAFTSIGISGATTQIMEMIPTALGG